MSFGHKGRTLTTGLYYAISTLNFNRHMGICNFALNFIYIQTVQVT